MTERSVDTSLDFFSEEFDPIKALASVSLQPPVNIKPFDYLEKCRILLDPSDPNYLPINAKLLEKQKQQVKKEAAPVPTNIVADSAAGTGTNEGNNTNQDKPSDAPPPSNNTNATVTSAGTSTEPPKRKNVLQSMMDELHQGPVALLHECCAQRARVRVVIRRVKDVRGHCTGQLIAYDKYFNLVRQLTRVIITSY
jgi:small nuclear ribonucleoprotein (snRNP)-like protein